VRFERKKELIFDVGKEMIDLAIKKEKIGYKTISE
jgi:hypothetical protein